MKEQALYAWDGDHYGRGQAHLCCLLYFGDHFGHCDDQLLDREAIRLDEDEERFVRRLRRQRRTPQEIEDPMPPAELMALAEKVTDQAKRLAEERLQQEKRRL